MIEPAASPDKDPGDGKLVPPYFAFKTFTNQLDFMKERGVPARIDRSFLVGMSGAGQAQYITGLRSLGLIDSSGKVSGRLTEIATGSPSDRKRLFRETLQERYAKAIELGKQNATTGQLVELFREEYGATGDTARKAIAFYLNAAKYVGDIPLSPMFTTPKVTSSGGTRKRKVKPETNGAAGGGTPPTPPATPTAFSDLHPALAGVLSELPKVGKGWTVQRRSEFMKTFEAVANFTIPVVEDDEFEAEEDVFEEDETTL